MNQENLDLSKFFKIDDNVSHHNSVILNLLPVTYLFVLIYIFFFRF